MKAGKVSINVEVDAQRGAEAARLIWDDTPEAECIQDPRTPSFAHAMIDTASEILHGSKGLIRRMIARAAAGAEDLAVGQFQGITEVIQNADDVGASEVRIALRETDTGPQLLLVHNGQPVTCYNVLPMALPYLTTKTERADQRGRFGIGLKTLRRIADSVSVHSSPYHFSGDQLHFERIEGERPLPGFYEPSTDTMVVVTLNNTFDEQALTAWFGEWTADGLMFLSSVSRFRWCELDGTTRHQRLLTFTDWAPAPFPLHQKSIAQLQSRRVEGPEDAWTVWRATVSVPAHLHPAHKARTETTEISISLADGDSAPAIFIGFRTQIPQTLPFSIDAQFDPSTSREAIIENPWNTWLIQRVGTVVGEIASGLLSTEPLAAWRLIPLSSQSVGSEGHPWLPAQFENALTQSRQFVSEGALISVKAGLHRLSDIVYECAELEGLISELDLQTLADGQIALSFNVRDQSRRWRRVLRELDTAAEIGTSDLLEALDRGQFDEKDTDWWIRAGERLVEHHPYDDLFGKKFLRSEDDGPLECHAAEDSDHPIVFNAVSSAFAARWGLFKSLHPSYGTNKAGQAVLKWLRTEAAYADDLNAEIELAAFAEHFSTNAIEITDEDLRNIRNRFDEIPDRRAEELGAKVGSIILLDGFCYQSGRTVQKKIPVTSGYLSKTIDGENSTWPQAAGKTPSLNWIAARYDAVLRTDAPRWTKRKRHDGVVSRGPRRFLMLLGAETAPRLMREEGPIRWGAITRIRELQSCGAEQVEYDLLSPDLTKVLQEIVALPKNEAKQRCLSLLQTISRNWTRTYAHNSTVPAEHVARVYTYDKGPVTASWLNELKHTAWIPVGRGELVEPKLAVLRTPETQAIYQTFIWNIGPQDIDEGMARALGLITDVRVGDLLTHLEELRDGESEVEANQTESIYRAIAKRCPRNVSFNARVGEISVQELRRRFLQSGGLIHVGGGRWLAPDQVIRGLDIFHGRFQFVPGGNACSSLWITLGVAEPSLGDCIQFCRDLTSEPYSGETEAALMDVYRYMERLAQPVDRRSREKLRFLPLYTKSGWAATRPIYYVEDPEQREQLATMEPTLRLWSPPCDPQDLPRLMELIAVERLIPELTVEDAAEEAAERGAELQVRFRHATDHLSAELARSASALRDRIIVSWDELKSAILLVHDQPFVAYAKASSLPRAGVPLKLRSLALAGPLTFHLCRDDIGDREFGGRAIASLFPREVRRRIDAEWVLAWQKSRDTAAEEIRLASDEKRAEAMREAADAINASGKRKIRVTPSANKKSALPPRTLKDKVGSIVGATAHPGSPVKKANGSKSGSRGLKPAAPDPNPSKPSAASAATAFTNADVEQRGWEILVQALNTSDDQRLVDFRRNHGVGADGAIDWTRFVEMKATTRSPQSQVEMSNAEFERAKQRGSNFILALVSGLESGFTDEVRLIFDPVNCAAVRPTNGVRLTRLLDAPSVIVRFSEPE